MQQGYWTHFEHTKTRSFVKSEINWSKVGLFNGLFKSLFWIELMWFTGVKGLKRILILTRGKDNKQVQEFSEAYKSTLVRVH